jgi:ribosomal protein S12 methylthiotransferase
VRAAEFDWMGVFGYSDQEGAKSSELENKIKVPAREIEHRRKKLMKIQQQISRRRKQSLVGRQYDLLVEGPSEESDLLWEGRTEMHAPEIDGKVYISDFGDRESLTPGEFVRCEVTEAHDYDLVVKVL